jgi:transaldolase
MGLERLIQRGESVGEVVCFASVSMSHLNAVINPLIVNSETSFSLVQARILYQHYHQFYESECWRSLPKGVKPLRLVWDCTDIPPESAWRYLQTLAIPGTVIMLSPSTLELYREVSLLPTSVTDGKSVEQNLTSRLQMEIPLNGQVNQVMNEEMARSLNAFYQLLNTIEKKRMC